MLPEIVHSESLSERKPPTGAQGNIPGKRSFRGKETFGGGSFEDAKSVCISRESTANFRIIKRHCTMELGTSTEVRIYPG